MVGFDPLIKDIQFNKTKLSVKNSEQFLISFASSVSLLFNKAVLIIKETFNSFGCLSLKTAFIFLITILF